MNVEWFYTEKMLVMTVDTGLGATVQSYGAEDLSIKVYPLASVRRLGNKTPTEKIQQVLMTGKESFGVAEFGTAAIHFSPIQLAHAIVAVLDQADEEAEEMLHD